MNGSHDLTALGPVNGTGPKPLAAVCCSESCSRGLRLRDQLRGRLEVRRQRMDAARR